MGLMERPKIIVSNLKDLIPLSISVIVLNFSGMPCIFNICDVWCDLKERIQATQSIYLMRLCMWTTCTPFCTARFMIVYWRNSIGTLGINRGRCLEKLDAVISILLGTDDTTQLLWSLKPQDIFNYKFTAWKIHYPSCDLFFPLHIFWQPIPLVSIRLYEICRVVHNWPHANCRALFVHEFFSESALAKSVV